MMFNIESVFRTLSLAVLSVALFIAGCEDKDETTEQENITTIQLKITGPGFTGEYEWNDLDGPGGNAPVIDEIALPPLSGNIYCHVHVFDRSKNPEQEITAEIEAEKNAHLLTYQIDASLDATWEYGDVDDNGKPIGLITRWTTDQPSTGNLRITLYHEPTNKDDLGNPGGEVDFDVTFPVKIQ